MHKYVYRNKRTGIKVYTNQPLKSPNLELVSEVRDGKIKTAKVIKK